MADLDVLRADLKAFAAEAAPPSLLGTRTGAFDGFWGGRKWTHDNGDYERWRDRCLARGLTAPTWPKAYGGAGMQADEARIWHEVLVDAGLPNPVVGFGLTMIGPTLLHYGSEEQKKQHLPAIVRGDLRWCQGYSEPGAGSDLASLSAKAERRGDALVVSGQKIWTSFADQSDWIFALVRTLKTARKQEGITFVLIDMASPGVSTRPIELISGQSPFCEVFFDQVEVPLDNVVGAVDQGWEVAKALLGFERSMIGAAVGGQLQGVEPQLVALARQHLGCPEGPLSDADLRQRIAAYAMDESCYHHVLEGIDAARQRGETPGPEASIVKLVGSELKQQRFDLELAILGQAGLGWEGPGFSAADLAATRAWLRSRASSIEGGTSEIHTNILAQRVLGLPKGSA